ncbi:hypothetical protein [Hyperthermus butylicus]|uniref:Uncharacterized protein n=1 Tax=Hyperthermus butylicus (strain DSM 5456 / JCM 9403 / PLM1-5) TaxID=415426 RepID=A2BK60_HYPBU|nr:hypothetical protein [Hyperthermus butylicus]ABM80371.1 hypothetical protein Hbut_0509 [Hyperthermus butylicus DSM 5456]
MVSRLARYIFLVKNLRGVFAVSQSDDAEHYVQWLARRFRYRDVGVSRYLASRLEGIIDKWLEGNPFHLLDYPSKAAEEAAARVRDVLVGAGLSVEVADSILLSLYYASPILASRTVYEETKSVGIVVETVYGPKLSQKDAKLHMRIAGYSVLDFLVPITSKAADYIGSTHDIERLSAERLEAIRADTKRYWRISGKGSEPVIAYIDYLKLLDEAGILSELTSSEGLVLLAIPVLFVLDSVEGLGAG